MPNDDEIRQILADKSLSDWFRTALLSALDGDPVQAAQDAGLWTVGLRRLRRNWLPLKPLPKLGGGHEPAPCGCVDRGRVAVERTKSSYAWL